MWILYLPLLFISLLVLYLYNKVQNGKKRVYHISTRKPLRVLSLWDSLRTLFSSSRNERLTVSIEKNIAASLNAGDPMFMNWFLFTPVVVVTDLDAILSILKEIDVFPKYNFAAPGPAGKFIGNSGIAVVNGEQWKTHRRLLNAPFVKNHVFFSPLNEVVSYFVENVLAPADNEKKAIHIGHHFQSLTLDSLGISVFGKNFGLVKGNTDTPMNSYEYAVEKIVQPIRLIPFTRFFLKDTNELDRHVNIFTDYVTHIIENDVEYDTNTIIGALLESFKAGEITEDVVRSNIVTFFIAGHETTANELMFVLYHLATYPEEQEKVRENIVQVISESGYNYESVKSMKQLDNFLEEVFRIEPTVPILGIRSTSEDVELADHFIPKGTLIVPTIKHNQMNPNIWENPKEFNPDRMNNLTKEQKKAQMLFSAGPRLCIGKAFSILEQKMVVCEILRNYRVHLTEDSEYGITAKFLVLPEDSKLKFYFTKL